MKLPISLKIAFKYLRPNKSTVSIINIISTLGVLLGVAVLIIVLSIMNGFGEAWREKLLSVNAHINLLPSSSKVSSWRDTIHSVSSLDKVKTAAPIIDGLVLMQSNNKIKTPILRGIDFSVEQSDCKQFTKLNDKGGIFSLNNNELILSSGLARRLDVQIGDQVLVTTSNDILLKDEIRFPSEITVSGIFNIGIYDIDENFAFVLLLILQMIYLN